MSGMSLEFLKSSLFEYGCNIEKAAEQFKEQFEINQGNEYFQKKSVDTFLSKVHENVKRIENEAGKWEVNGLK